MSAVLGDTSVTTAGTPGSPTERYHPQENRTLNYEETQTLRGCPAPVPFCLFIPTFGGGHIILGSGIFGGPCRQWSSDFQMVISCAPIQPHPASQAQGCLLHTLWKPRSSFRASPLLRPVLPFPIDFWKDLFVCLFVFSLCPLAQKCHCHLQQALLDHHPTVPCPFPLPLVALGCQHPGTTPMASPSSHCPWRANCSSCVTGCLRATARSGRDL